MGGETDNSNATALNEHCASYCDKGLDLIPRPSKNCPLPHGYTAKLPDLGKKAQWLCDLVYTGYSKPSHTLIQVSNIRSVLEWSSL